MMQRASGSTVAVTLCFQAASPAGVRGSFKSGKILGDVAAGDHAAQAFPIAAEVGMAVGHARRRLGGPEGSGAVISCARIGEHRRASSVRAARGVVWLTSMQYYSIAKYVEEVPR